MSNIHFNEVIYPIAKLGEDCLLILRSQLSKVGKGLGVLAVRIGMEDLHISRPEDLERHLKFNPWVEITSENDRLSILELIFGKLSEEVIQRKILNPLKGLKEQVYLASNLRNDQHEFYGKFTRILTLNDILPVELQNVNDIWCRDFMPVRSSKGSHLLFNYDPGYLDYNKYREKKTPRSSIIAMLGQLGISFEDIQDIKIDGGNVVGCGGKVIMTDMIFKENGIDKKDRLGQDRLRERLKDLFQSEVIIIPHQPGDILGHSDGILRFLNPETVLVNNFSSVTTKESKNFLDNLYGTVGGAGLNIVHVPYAPVKGTGKENMPLAYGFYINYLETSELIFLPQFGNEFRDRDNEAVEVFSGIFKTVGKRVIPVDSGHIANSGGVLNCITWN